MSDKTKFILGASLLLIGLQFTSIGAQAQTNPNISKMYGEIGITNNYVDRGITQSNKGPSLSAGFGYRFGGQGKIGFDSSSVKFPNEDANVEMRVYGEYKFVFTPNADLTLRDDLVRYFSEDNRNKMLVSLDQNIFSYHFLASREDNFEGTKNPRNWFGIHKDWPYGTNTQINMTVGYSMVSGHDSYFDGLLGMSYLVSNMTFSLAGTYVSTASDFNGMADPFVIFRIDARF